MLKKLFFELLTIILQIFGYLYELLISVLKIDSMETIEEYFAGLPVLSEALIYLGIILLFVYSVAEGIKLLTGGVFGGREKPSAKVFIGLLFWSLITWFSIDIGKAIFSIFGGWLGKLHEFTEKKVAENLANDSLTELISPDLLEDTLAGVLDSALEFLNGILILVVLIYLFKILLQVAEKYLYIALTIYSAPICVAAGVMGDDGGNVAGKWFSALLSNIISLLLTDFGIEVLRFINIEGFTGSISVSLLLTCAWLTVVSKIDDFLKSVGFNAQRTGGNLALAVGGAIMATARAAGSFGTGVRGYERGERAAKADLLRKDKVGLTLGEKYSGNGKAFFSSEEYLSGTRNMSGTEKASYDKYMRNILGNRNENVVSPDGEKVASEILSKDAFTSGNTSYSHLDYYKGDYEAMCGSSAYISGTKDLSTLEKARCNLYLYEKLGNGKGSVSLERSKGEAVAMEAMSRRDTLGVTNKDFFMGNPDGFRKTEEYLKDIERMSPPSRDGYEKSIERELNGK